MIINLRIYAKGNKRLVYKTTYDYKIRNWASARSMSLQSSKVPCERFSTGSGIKNTTAPTSLDQQGQQTQLDSASSSSAALGEEHTVKN